MGVGFCCADFQIHFGFFWGGLFVVVKGSGIVVQGRGVVYVQYEVFCYRVSVFTWASYDYDCRFDLGAICVYGFVSVTIDLVNGGRVTSGVRLFGFSRVNLVRYDGRGLRFARSVSPWGVL